MKNVRITPTESSARWDDRVGGWVVPPAHVPVDPWAEIRARDMSAAAAYQAAAATEEIRILAEEPGVVETIRLRLARVAARIASEGLRRPPEVSAAAAAAIIRKARESRGVRPDRREHPGRAAFDYRGEWPGMCAAVDAADGVK